MVAQHNIHQMPDNWHHYAEMIMGEWCDTNGLLDYMPDGRLLAHFDDGSSEEGTWQMEGNLLIRQYSDRTYTTTILDMTDEQYIEKMPPPLNTINKVIRINNR